MENLDVSSIEVNIDDMEIVDGSQDENEQPVVKRPRGRPRKAVPEEPVIKRPRGRPVKDRVEPAEPPEPRNPVGRPRKVVVEPVVKNPVGRPKKPVLEPVVKNPVGRPPNPVDETAVKNPVGRPRTVESYDGYFKQYYHDKVKLKNAPKHYLKSIIKEIIIEQLHD